MSPRVAVKSLLISRREAAINWPKGNYLNFVNKNCALNVCFLSFLFFLLKKGPTCFSFGCFFYAPLGPSNQLFTCPKISS